ncbi:MAG: hypothetical protein LBT08_06385 [Synergistaceae bacterium]|jgi:Zn-dependent protease|nr:hypothetical protein [Synergistaceae bacterium]
MPVSLLIKIAALLIGAYGIVFLMIVWRFSRLRLRRPEISCVERASLPEDVSRRLDLAEPFLLGQGFAYGYSVRMDSIFDVPGMKEEYSNVYVHEESGAHAAVSTSIPTAPYHIGYVSCFAEGDSWETFNRLEYAVPDLSDGNTLFDDYLPDDEAVWRAHISRVSASDRLVIRDAERVRNISLAQSMSMIDNWIARGVIKPSTQADRWRFTWTAAYRLFRKMRRGAKKLRRLPNFSYPSGTEERENLETDALARSRNLSRSLSLSTAQKRVVCAVTAVISLAVFAWFSGWAFALALLGTLALHEGGHLLAMRLSGYPDASVFFIPGIGGVTVGEKLDASPFQRLFVYLAGPAPGLLISMALVGMIELRYPFLLTQNFKITTFILLSVNYLNLLPIFPLDGGRIVELLAFSRHPRARFIFYILGLASIAGFGLATRNPLLLALWLLLVAAIRAEWDRMLVWIAIGRNADKMSEEEAGRLVFRTLHEPRFEKWSNERRNSAVSAIMPNLVGRRIRFGEAAAGIFIYLLCLIAPPAALIAAWSRV